MNTPIRTTVALLAVACVSVGATSKIQKRLTPHRIAELTAPAEAPAVKGYTIRIDNLRWPSPKGAQFSPHFGPGDLVPASVTLPAENPKGLMEVIRECRFPIEFEPPLATDEAPGITPITPKAFETVNTGWTIHLSAKPQGKLVAIYGVADYVEDEFIPGGYGPLSGPIHSDQGKLISPNVLSQPKFQTTSTRFHIFAVPGESYEVTLYRGAKAEKHMVTVLTE